MLGNKLSLESALIETATEPKRTSFLKKKKQFLQFDTYGLNEDLIANLKLKPCSSLIFEACVDSYS